MQSGRTTTVMVALSLGLVMAAGCAKKPEVPGSPEDVYRRFALANLTGSEQAIRPLFIDHPDAAILWSEGAYPADVAEELGKHYREMKIVRIEEKFEWVLMKGSDSPIPMELRRIDGVWRLDASPIIDFRKRAAAQRGSDSSRLP
ncbi:MULTISPECIES: hypothetical protein [unclassified Myxococcus]|uniref:hypothetical protein n=1 Tax=unclassified Myxococcus TaxID=2648731 RepID=UPI001CC1153A|nr:MULTISPECIES: hypothetical protein [unclassified Myxococcus]MBZ4397347.1 hypothetical protein [Myxococcus sp. AS-1-15]MBZ4410682.1 hypothetical protein [Myxococcus sp. XM-1-1-1]